VAAGRDHQLYAVPMTLETPSSVAVFLASQLAVAGSLEAVRGYYDALAAITPADVARVAQSHLTERQRYVVTLREVREPAAAPEAGGAS
jgi:predicted Zn-dependent peptidase